jgi:hypothetical protein
MKTFANGLEPGVQAHSAGVQRRHTAQALNAGAGAGAEKLCTVRHHFPVHRSALFSCTPFRHVDFQQKK